MGTTDPIGHPEPARDFWDHQGPDDGPKRWVCYYIKEDTPGTTYQHDDPQCAEGKTLRRTRTDRPLCPDCTD